MGNKREGRGEILEITYPDQMNVLIKERKNSFSKTTEEQGLMSST